MFAIVCDDIKVGTLIGLKFPDHEAALEIAAELNRSAGEGRQPFRVQWLHDRCQPCGPPRSFQPNG